MKGLFLVVPVGVLLGPVHNTDVSARPKNSVKTTCPEFIYLLKKRDRRARLLRSPAAVIQGVFIRVFMNSSPSPRAPPRLIQLTCTRSDLPSAFSAALKPTNAFSSHFIVCTIQVLLPAHKSRIDWRRWHGGHRSLPSTRCGVQLLHSFFLALNSVPVQIARVELCGWFLLWDWCKWGNGV